MRCWKRWCWVVDSPSSSPRTVLLGLIVGGLISLLLSARPAPASQLAVPSSGPTDGSLGGATVALPTNASTAVFSNPAQLGVLPPSFSSGVLAIRFHPTYENALGYHSTSRELPVAPNFGYVTDSFGSFRFGIGAYGSLGFMFNHRSDPAHGVPNNFFTELVSVSLAPSISYAVSPNLHLGVSLNPTYGRLKFKTPSPVGRLDIDARGPGVFGTLGLLYQPTEKLYLGLSYKTPGHIWMFGNARVAGAGDDTTVGFNIPQRMRLGFAYRLTERLTLTAQGMWTQYSVFEDTRLRFEKRPFLDSPALGDAKDRWRLSSGLQYEILPGIKFRAGFSYEPWAIKDASLVPTLADTTDYLFSLGLAFERGNWQVDLGGGLSHTETRHASRAENPVAPGRYLLDMSVFGVQVTRLFGSQPAVPTASRRTAPVRHARISDTYATISERRADSVLGTLISRLSADRCHDLSPLQRAVPGCTFGIQVVGFIGNRPSPTLASANLPAQTGTAPSSAPAPTAAAGEASLDTLIQRLAATQCRQQAPGRATLPGCV